VVQIASPSIFSIGVTVLSDLPSASFETIAGAIRKTGMNASVVKEIASESLVHLSWWN